MESVQKGRAGRFAVPFVSFVTIGGVSASTAVCVSASEMDMGWVHPWVGSHFPAHMMGWVSWVE